ncbi:MAG: fluoroacetyl-CoA thioesterase [Solirubrobacteraceae bacterium]|nr:fluoroacetyl-CoA thioesterase [Solirubrobacteraceae bacterium]
MIAIREDPFTVENLLLTDVRGTIPVRVLSTPGMIAMMERCAASLALEHVPEGRATVGFEVCIRHVAAAQEGAQCVARAVLREIVDERKLASTSRCARANASLAWVHMSGGRWIARSPPRRGSRQDAVSDLVIASVWLPIAKYAGCTTVGAGIPPYSAPTKGSCAAALSFRAARRAFQKACRSATLVST